MTDETIGNADVNSAGQRAERRHADRRRDLRYPFTAAVEVFEPQSQTKLNGRTPDISVGGCYVDTINPLPVSTSIKIRLTKDGIIFEADAKVVLCHAGMGMGVCFFLPYPGKAGFFRNG